MNTCTHSSGLCQTKYSHNSSVVAGWTGYTLKAFTLVHTPTAMACSCTSTFMASVADLAWEAHFGAFVVNN